MPGDRIAGEVYIVKGSGTEDHLVSVQQCWACEHLLPVVVPGTGYDCIQEGCPGGYMEVQLGEG